MSFNVPTPPGLLMFRPAVAVLDMRRWRYRAFSAWLVAAGLRPWLSAIVIWTMTPARRPLRRGA